jgi:hypothetical protein
LQTPKCVLLNCNKQRLYTQEEKKAFFAFLMLFYFYTYTSND